MAINTNSAVTFFGDRKNRKQMIMGIPAEAVANKPGIVNLQSVSGTTVTDGFLFRDTSGRLKTHTSIPTDVDAQGVLYETGSSGATVALDNLDTVQINTSLLSDAANTDDLGSDSTSWKRLYLGTSAHFIGTTFDYNITFTEPGATRAYDFVDAGADGEIMINVGGANEISFAKGSSSIEFGANADLDIAAGFTVDINADLTVSATSVIDQDLSAGGAPTWTSKVTCQGIDNTDTAIDTTAEINIGADNVYMTWGDSDSADSRIYYSGTNLMLYDSTLGVARTLTEMYTGTTLNPSVTGNLAIPDGNFTWTNAATDETAVFTFAATTVDAIQIASSNTDSDVIQITASATTSGSLVYLVAADATMTSGAYIMGHDGSAQAFAFRRYGALTIAGNAAEVDALTLTKGDIKITEGFIDSDSPVGTGGHNFATADDGTSATPFITITNSNAAFDQAMILLDSNATGAYDAMQITHDSTGYGLSITGTAATGGQLFIDGPASQTERMVDIAGTWIGKSTEGMVDITNSSVLLAGANVLRIDSSGHNAALAFAVEIINSGNTVDSTDGAAFRVDHTGTAQAGTVYAVYIGSTADHGLKITTGAVGGNNLYVDGVAAQIVSIIDVVGTTGTGWDGADDTGCVNIKTLESVHVGAAGLVVDHAATPIAAGEGVCARFIQSTGSATTDAYLVQIEGKATGGGLHVKTGYATFGEGIHVSGGHFTDFTTVTEDGTNDAIEYTAAMLLGGMIIRDGIDADKTDVIATATDIVAAIPGCVAGTSFQVFVKNVDATNDIIVSAGSDIDLVGGSITLDTNEMVHLLFVVTDAATEAVTVHNLGLRVIATT